MHYTIEEVYNYVKNFHLKDNHFTEEDVEEYFIAEIDESAIVSNFTYDVGISKCVIIPNDTDYVIKIPFTGDFDVEFGEILEYKDFYGGGGKFFTDYCALEEDIYRDIKDSTIKQFFLPIKKVLEINGYPIYIQPKATIYKDEDDEKDNYKYCSKKSLKSIKQLSKKRCIQVSLPYDWLANVLDILNNDEIKLLNFLDYLKKEDISKDLHRGNIGYLNGKAVLIDYAGFWED